MPNITFVDENDKVIGSGTREEAKAKGIAHRIARIFVFNSKGQLLLQKRAAHVNAPNKWDQSAGGHVDEGEDYAAAAARELEEELGVAGTALTEVTKFYTETHDGPEIVKRFNMLYKTDYDGEIHFDPDEVAGTRWIDPEALSEWMTDKPKEFTRSFILAFRYYQELQG